MLELKNVSKFYYNKGVIATGFSKVNLKLDIGEFVAITGESGSGKSTLLNVISGLDTYEEGEMYINGKETSHYSDKDFEDFRRKYIGNIFQTFNLVNSYTVYQNIELVLLLNGYKKRKIKKQVLELIKKVDLYKFKNTKVSKLSGGQKQRVAIARALAKETPIIIADEPTGNLDKEAAESTIKLLSEIAKDKLVVIVTHNYEQIEKYVTRKITMHDGRIIEDKKIKETKNTKKANEVEYKNITLFNRLRLGIRNTFNIKTKFALLFLVFMFMTSAIIAQYANSRKQKHLAEREGENYIFQNCSENRIVIKKKDGLQFSEEEYAKLENIENIDYIVKDDALLDTGVDLGDNEYFSIYGRATSIKGFKGKLDVGRMPENDNEIIVEGHKDDYYIQALVNRLENATLYLVDLYTGTMNKDVKMQVVGIKYFTNSNDYYGNSNIYVSDAILNKMRFQINQTYSQIKVLFQGKYYESTLFNPYFTVRTSENVPVGKAYVSNDLNYEVPSGSCRNKPIKIEVNNLYYQKEIELTIARTYTKYNMKSLVGGEYEMSNGTIYINPEDYNKLFDKPSYQSSVFIKDMALLRNTALELENLGYKTLIIKDTMVKVGQSQLVEIFQTIATIVLIVTLFFITYFIIKVILKSRNTYFAIIRMLGATRKKCKQLLIIELLVVENLAFIISLSVVVLQAKHLINLGFIQTIVDYLKIKDYVILYVVLMAMSYIISLKYARKLFKDSSIKTYNEEV